jgi:hypothetical protein
MGSVPFPPVGALMSCHNVGQNALVHFNRG